MGRIALVLGRMHDRDRARVADLRRMDERLEQRQFDLLRPFDGDPALQGLLATAAARRIAAISRERSLLAAQMVDARNAAMSSARLATQAKTHGERLRKHAEDMALRRELEEIAGVRRD